MNALSVCAKMVVTKMEIIVTILITIVLTKYLISPLINGVVSDTKKQTLYRAGSFLALFILLLIFLTTDNEVKLTPEQKQNNINILLTKIESTPKADYHQLSFNYEELLKLDPNNKAFKKEFKHYNDIVELESECGSIIFTDVKNQSKFPDTFESIGIKQYWLVNDTIRVRMNYKANNAFGVPIRGTALYECKYNNDIIEYKRLEFR